MKLSEAIRLGALMKPQAFGSLRGGQSGLDGNKSCAWQAGADALGVTAFDLIHMYPEFVHAICPVEGCLRIFREIGNIPFWWVVTHLNDTHQWSREQIANWVEQQELTLPTSQSDRASAQSDPVECRHLPASELVAR